MLFEQSARNKQMVEQINRQVMRTVRRDMRRKMVVKWAKLIGMCFGLPLAVMAYIYLLATYMPVMPQELMIACYLIPITTIAVLIGYRLRNFSLLDM